MCYSPLQI